MQTTILSYYNNTYQFEDTAQVMAVFSDTTQRIIVILDKTIMYPQGGGQLYDIGTIMSNGTIFRVTEVRFAEGIVHHIGFFESGNFETGAMVRVFIDENRRRLNARLHSAGHILDEAVRLLGYSIEPIKGYHFPAGPYVEYAGEINGDLVTVAQTIELKVQSLIATNQIVHTQIVLPKDSFVVRENMLSSDVPTYKLMRTVTMIHPIPCGGTHVSQLGDIGVMKITKVKMKGKNIRVSYELE